MADTPLADFGSRLRTARKMAGLSLEDLSGKIGGVVTRQAISKYEKGRMMPSPEVLCSLTQTLAIQPYAAPEPIECFRLARVAEPPLIPPSTTRSQREKHISRALVQKREDTSFALYQMRDRDEVPAAPHDMAGLASRRKFRMRRADADASLAAPAVPVPEPALAQVRFREREKLPAKTAVALRLRVADYVRRCHEIESALGLVHTFNNPLAGCTVRTAADVETAASDVRRAWDLGSGPVTNLLGLLEEKGIRVFELRGIVGFEGLSGNYGTVPFVTVSRDFPDDRVRFTAAHELGHLLCGFPKREGTESLCHAFAGAFLLPREAAEKALMPARRKVSLWELKELKESYGISLQAIVHRARSLGLITGRQFRKFREMIREKGWLVTEPVEYRGNEQASRLRRLLSYAVTERIVEPERAAALAGVPVGEFIGELGPIF